MGKIKTIIKSKYFLLNLLMIISIIFPACHALDYSIKISEPQEAYNISSGVYIGFEAKGRRRSDFLRPFKCRLYFDPNTLEYKKIICKNSVKRSDIKVEKFDNYVDIFCSPNALRELYFPQGVSDIFDLVFTVNQKATTHESDVTAEFKPFNRENILNSQNIKLNIIGNLLLEKCKLNFLDISEGNLSPEFSPNIYEYTATVPYYTKQLDVQAIPMCEDLSVKINKRNLNINEGTVNVIVTVSNKSLGVKSVYTIKVSREKSMEDNSSNYSHSNSSPKISNKKRPSKVSAGAGKVLNEQINIFEPDKKSSKTKSSKSNRKKKKKSKNSKKSTKEAEESNENEDNEENTQDDNEENNQEDTENENALDDSDNNTSLIFKNSKIYWVITAVIFGCSVAIYLIIKFIKSKKHFKNQEKDINNDSKK